MSQPTITTAHNFLCEVCEAPGVMVLGAKVEHVVNRGQPTEYVSRSFDMARPGHVRCGAHCGHSGADLDEAAG